MRNYVQDGSALDLVLAAAVLSGAGVKAGQIVGIAAVDGDIGDTIAVHVEGVYDVTSDTGAAWAVGDVVYWDDTNKRFTKTTTSNTKAGVAVEAKLSAATTGRVRLVPNLG